MRSFHRTIIASIGFLVLFSFFELYNNVSFFFDRVVGLSNHDHQQQQQQDNDSSNQDKQDNAKKVKAQLLGSGSVVMRKVASSLPSTLVVLPKTPVRSLSCEEQKNKAHFHGEASDSTYTNTNTEDEELACTPQQGKYQASNYCPIYMGRHNLKEFFTLARFHMPDAKLLIDIGANKGLVSSRWLELWRPELNQTAKQHVAFVMQYIKDNAPGGTKDNWCGVTYMCDKPDLFERVYLEQCAPVSQEEEEGQQPSSFEVYSFEPSPHLFQMQEYYMSTLASDSLRAVWKWFPFAASDRIQQVRFEGMWNEGSKIKGVSLANPAAAAASATTSTTTTTTTTTTTPGGGVVVPSNGNIITTTTTVTLDSLAGYPPPHNQQQQQQQQQHDVNEQADVNKNPNNLLGNRTIDVLKIDAETVDGAVLVGASHLLFNERIRVVMWETPNVYPLLFPDWFGGVAMNFGQLIHRLDVHANMTCYFPGMNSKMIKLTKCWDGYLSTAPKCKNLPIDKSNAICISRTKARSLYRAVEANALIHQAAAGISST